MVSSLNIVLNFIFYLAVTLFLIRFLLQASGADSHNAISQAVVKGTDPLCKPLRMLLRPYRNLDFASIVVAWLIATISIAALAYINYGAMPPVLGVLWAGLIKMLLVLTQFYKFTIFIVVIASFLVQGNFHPALLLLHQILEPLVGPIRRVLPSLGPIDISPLVLILIIFLVENLLSQVGPI